jgi:hypothetical protein
VQNEILREKPKTIKEFQMFTEAGNVAVSAIVERAIKVHDFRCSAYDSVYGDLLLLSEVKCFSESFDTAVREAVWAEICKCLPDINDET